MKCAVWVLGFLFGLIPVVSQAESPAPPEFKAALPSGDYVYSHHYTVPQVRRSEVVNTAGSAGLDRLKELRARGFLCLRRNSGSHLCTKSEKPGSWPDALQEAIERQMTGFTISFAGPFSEPRLVIDTFTTQEWMVYGKVKIQETPVQAFKYVYHYDTGQATLAFPVDEDQPIPLARYEEPNRMYLNFMVQSKDGPQTLGYSIEVELAR